MSDDDALASIRRSLARSNLERRIRKILAGAPNEPTPGARKCRGHDGTCTRRLTWAEERVQYGRAIRAGLTRAQAEAAGPLCARCMTAHLRPGIDRA